MKAFQDKFNEMDRRFGPQFFEFATQRRRAALAKLADFVATHTPVAERINMVETPARIFLTVQLA